MYQRPASLRSNKNVNSDYYYYCQSKRSSHRRSDPKDHPYDCPSSLPLPRRQQSARHMSWSPIEDRLAEEIINPYDEVGEGKKKEDKEENRRNVDVAKERESKVEDDDDGKREIPALRFHCLPSVKTGARRRKKL